MVKTKKRCKRGTRKNKQGMCEISACQKELNKLRNVLESQEKLFNQLFPKLDKVQKKVDNLADKY